MRKSLINLILVTLLLIISSCQPAGPSLRDAFSLSPGMTKSQVVETIGKPKKSEFDRNVEEWFYCISYTGEYLSVFFENGILFKTLNYSVTPPWQRGGDVNNTAGECVLNFKKGNYRVPDEVTEVRLKVDSKIEIK